MLTNQFPFIKLEKTLGNAHPISFLPPESQNKFVPNGGDAALDQAVGGDVLELFIALFPHHCANVAYGLRRGALSSCQRTERRVMVSGHLTERVTKLENDRLQYKESTLIFYCRAQAPQHILGNDRGEGSDPRSRYPLD